MDSIHFIELFPTHSLSTKFYIIDSNRFINSDFTKILAWKLLFDELNQYGIQIIEYSKTDIDKRKKYSNWKKEFIKTRGW